MPPSTTFPSQATHQQLPHLHDILIIGAGPAALAVAARLRENTPSALYTDEEHRRFHFLRQTKRTNHPRHDLDILVLDAESRAWMGKWHRLFDALQISHLRSPMFFHPDPADRDALRAFAHERGREGEVQEIGGVVGREVSKHSVKKRKRKAARKGRVECGNRVNERERADYYAPSSRLFGDFCEEVGGRYGLDGEGEMGLVRTERVEDVQFSMVRALDEEAELFTVRTDMGVHYARTVVLAVGAGNAPTVPPLFCCLPEGVRGEDAYCHALHLQSASDLLPQHVKRKIEQGRETNVVVVGGGLTSAQVADLCVKQGVGKVWMLMRGPMKVKPFDVDVSWMGKFRNQEKAAFWMADSDEERAATISKARGGGSITPRFSKTLHSHSLTPHLSLHPHTTITASFYSPATSSWTLTTTPSIHSLPETAIDYIVFATGVQSDIATLPYLQSLHRSRPIGVVEGLPVLSEDLKWREDVPLFVTGKLAGLRLGPGAGNLEGARAGAERVGVALEGMFGKEEARRDSGFGDQMSESWRRGVGGRYEVLGEE